MLKSKKMLKPPPSSFTLNMKPLFKKPKLMMHRKKLLPTSKLKLIKSRNIMLLKQITITKSSLPLRKKHLMPNPT